MIKVPSNNKILLGIVSLTLFISFLIFSGSLFAKKPLVGAGTWGSKLDSLETKVREFIGLPKTKYAPEIPTTEVVQEESSVIDVVDKVSPSVVSIVARTTTFDFFNGPSIDEQGIGTGFIVDSNGLIVTNSHVVDNADSKYSVVLKDGTTYDVEKVHLDEYSDLAILEIRARKLPAVSFADSDKIKVGQRAIAIGNALGQFQNTVTVGVVSGISRELNAQSGFGDSKTYEGVIQTDAALNPGNSGGPLLNSFGQVMGINVATTRGAENISFAIPVNKLKPILESFLKNGRIVRPYMGVMFKVVTPEIAYLRKLPEGAFVTGVVKDSPAEKAGIKRGDIIVKFDNHDVNDGFSLSNNVAEHAVGNTVDVVVDRSGKKLTLQVKLAEIPTTLPANSIN